MDDILEALDKSLRDGPSDDDITGSIRALISHLKDVRSYDVLLKDESDILDAILIFLREQIEEGNLPSFSKCMVPILGLFTVLAENGDSKLFADYIERSSLRDRLDDLLQQDIIQGRSRRILLKLCALVAWESQWSTGEKLHDLGRKSFTDLMRNNNFQSNILEINMYHAFFTAVKREKDFGDCLNEMKFIHALVGVLSSKRPNLEDYAEDLEIWIEIHINALASDVYKNSIHSNLELPEISTQFLSECVQNGNNTLTVLLLTSMANILEGQPLNVPLNSDTVGKELYAKYKEVRDRFTNAGIDELLIRILSESDSQIVKFHAVNVASYGFGNLEEKSNSVYVEEYLNVARDFLNENGETPGKLMFIPDSDISTSCYNVIATVSRLMINDTVKDLCADEQFLKLVVKFFEKPLDVSMLLLLLNIIDHLAFSKTARSIIEKQEDFMEFLQYLGKNTPQPPKRFSSCWQDRNAEVIQVSNGILFTMKKVPTSPEVIQPASEDEEDDLVMISYNWNSKDRVRILRRKLKEADFNVWIDEEQMPRYNDINAAMSDAVEKARVVLATISEDYYKSKNCRKELEYADEMDKPVMFIKTSHSFRPIGWLGLILGKKLWHVLEEPNIEKHCEEIIDALEKLLQKKASEKAESSKKTSTPASSSKSENSNSSLKCVKEYKKFADEDEYKKWLKKNGDELKFMKSWRNKSKFNRHSVNSLIKQCTDKSSNEFLQFLRKEFNLKTPEAMTLQAALDEIVCQK